MEGAKPGRRHQLDWPEVSAWCRGAWGCSPTRVCCGTCARPRPALSFGEVWPPWSLRPSLLGAAQDSAAAPKAPHPDGQRVFTFCPHLQSIQPLLGAPAR